MIEEFNIWEFPGCRGGGWSMWSACSSHSSSSLLIPPYVTPPLLYSNTTYIHDVLSQSSGRVFPIKIINTKSYIINRPHSSMAAGGASKLQGLDGLAIFSRNSHHFGSRFLWSEQVQDGLEYNTNLSAIVTDILRQWCRVHLLSC